MENVHLYVDRTIISPLDCWTYGALSGVLYKSHAECSNQDLTILQGHHQFDLSNGDEIAGMADIAFEECVVRERKGVTVTNFSKYSRNGFSTLVDCCGPKQTSSSRELHLKSKGEETHRQR